MNIQHMPGKVKSVIRGVPYILGIIDFSVPVGLGVGWEAARGSLYKSNSGFHS